MNTTGAQRVVVGALFAAGTLDLMADAAGHRRPSVRQTVGLAVTGLALSFLAGPAPTLAAGFALLLLTSTLYTLGLSSLARIGKALS